VAEEIDPKTGLKLRKLTELKNTAAKDMQDAMMKRVDELAVKDNKVKGQVENVIIKGLSALLDVKIKIDEMLGPNKDKLWKITENLLLAF
jgi:hypothetical protein